MGLGCYTALADLGHRWDFENALMENMFFNEDLKKCFFFQFFQSESCP